MKTLIFVILLMISSATYSSNLFNMDFETPETDIWIYQKSHHFNEKHDYNESHPLIGIRHNNLLVAAFKNSHSENSIAAMFYDELMDFNRYSSLHYAIGLATGYEEVVGKSGVMPYGFIGADFHTPDDKYGLTVNGIPGVIITIGFRYRF